VGRAVALRLAAAGWDVAFTYLTAQAEARELVEQFAHVGRRALPLRADLTDPATAADVAAAFASSFSRLDLLVHNAASFEPDDPHRMAEQFRRLMALHVQSPAVLTDTLAPLLRASGGRIITMLDILAERPWPAYSVYCANKAALASLTQSWARRWAPQVTANGIAPGVVEWPEHFDPGQRRRYLERVPLGRAGTPEDVAGLVYFLATDGAYINGQIIRLDGGRSLT
jgi:pteridine reductase